MRSIYGRTGPGWAGSGQWQFLLSLLPLLPALLPAVVLPSNSNNNNVLSLPDFYNVPSIFVCVRVCVTHAVVQLPRRSILLMAIDLCARRDFILGM